jgi:dUTP pyrophosphatase
MNNIKVLWKRLHADAKEPEYDRNGDSGCDLTVVEDYTIKPGKIALCSTGISIEMPHGVEGQVRPRSGKAIKEGLTVINTPGTIDSGYRGEIKVGLINLGEKDIFIRKGDQVAQLVFMPVYRAYFIPVEDLSATDRGAGGFGSTGR